MKYNGCPDSEVLAEYFKRFNYDPNRREEILKNMIFYLINILIRQNILQKSK